MNHVDSQVLSLASEQQSQGIKTVPRERERKGVHCNRH